MQWINKASKCYFQKVTWMLLFLINSTATTLLQGTLTFPLDNSNSLLVDILSSLALLESFLNTIAKLTFFFFFYTLQWLFFALKIQSPYVACKVLHNLVPLVVRTSHSFSTIFHSAPAKLTFLLLFEHGSFIPTIGSLPWLFSLHKVYWDSFAWLASHHLGLCSNITSYHRLNISVLPKFIWWNSNTQDDVIRRWVL